MSDSQRVAFRAQAAHTRAAVGPLLARLQRLTPADSLAYRATHDSLSALYAVHNAAVRGTLAPEQRGRFDANLAALRAAHRADEEARARDAFRVRGRSVLPAANAAGAAGGRP